MTDGVLLTGDLDARRRLPVFTLDGPMAGVVQGLTHIEWVMWVGYSDDPLTIQRVCVAPGQTPSDERMVWLGRYLYDDTEEGLRWVPLSPYAGWWATYGIRGGE